MWRQGVCPSSLSWAELHLWRDQTTAEGHALCVRAQGAAFKGIVAAPVDRLSPQADRAAGVVTRAWWCLQLPRACASTGQSAAHAAAPASPPPCNLWTAHCMRWSGACLGHPAARNFPSPRIWDSYLWGKQDCSPQVLIRLPSKSMRAPVCPRLTMQMAASSCTLTNHAPASGPIALCCQAGCDHGGQLRDRLCGPLRRLLRAGGADVHAAHGVPRHPLHLLLPGGARELFRQPEALCSSSNCAVRLGCNLPQRVVAALLCLRLSCTGSAWDHWCVFTWTRALQASNIRVHSGLLPPLKLALSWM